MPSTGMSYLDQYYSDQGYGLLDVDSDNNSEYIRSAEEGQCMPWKTDLYDYIRASKDAEVIHKKFNESKVCKGKIGKHNFAFVKSILPEQYRPHLLKTMIHNAPFPGLSIDSTEKVIYNAYDSFNNDYIKRILKN
jgi:hypothetical protein